MAKMKSKQYNITSLILKQRLIGKQPQDLTLSQANIFCLLQQQQSEIKMENKYQTIPPNFFYHHAPTLYLPPSQTIQTHASYPQDSLYHSPLNFETAFFHLQQQCEQLALQNRKLKQCLQNMSKGRLDIHIAKRKFIRRKEDQLDKKYDCCYQNCRKSYASELALNLHVKTKHRGGTKKQREDLAKLIIESEAHGRPTPTPTFRLPHGYLEEYRKRHSSFKESTPKPDS